MADELQSALDAAARAADVTWSPSQVAVAVHRRADRRRRHRRLATVSAAAALVAASVGGALVLTSSGDDRNVSIVDSTPDTSPPPDTDPVTTPTAPTLVDTTAPPVDTTAPIESVPPTTPVAGPIAPALTVDDPPLSPRTGSVILSVLTGSGDELIVDWGGHVPYERDIDKPPLNDGAVWSRSTGQWTPMSPSPLPGGSSSGASVGSLVVIANDAQVATYDAATDQWSVLQIPLSDHPPAVAEIVVALGTDVFFMQSEVTWNAMTNEWRAMSGREFVGSEPSERDVVTTNDSVISVDLASQGGLVVEQYDVASDTWTALPPPPGQHYGVAATVVTSSALVVVSWWEMTAWSLDLSTLEWTELPRVPVFPVKCDPNAMTYGSIVIVSMCGQLVALDGDHWRPFVAGSPNSVFDLLDLLPGEILIRGALYRGGNGINPIAEVLRTSPLRIAGLLVDGSIEPQHVTNVDNETITIDLPPSCLLSVGRTPPDGQRPFSAAVQAAADGPASVTWWNQYGAYELACPTAEAYSRSLAALRTEGELTSARDALDRFAGNGPWSSSGDAANELGPVVQDMYGEQDPVVGIGLGYFPDDPNTFTIESVGLADDSVSGQFFTITLQQSGDEWTIASATVSDVCARGVSSTDPSLCT